MTGAPFDIGRVVFDALSSAAAFTTARVLDNPTRASDLSDGERVVFFEDQSDKPLSSSVRTYSFAVAVINRTAEARKGAHQDYAAAKAVVLACMPAVGAVAKVDRRGLVEGDVLFRLENIDVGGGLVLGMFAIDYRSA